MKKEYLIGGIGGIILVGVVIYLLTNKKDKPQESSDVIFNGKPIPKLPEDFASNTRAQVNDLLEKKRQKYEALWKASGSKMTFKDWYIENAQ